MNYHEIAGEVFKDQRGSLFYINDFDMSPIKRFYIIENDESKPIRAWHGHKTESKWFYAIKGSFKIGLVKPDNWENPSPNLEVETILLKEIDHKIIHIPAGYANGFISLEKGSRLLIFSDTEVAKSNDDNIKFDINTWEIK